MFFIKKLNIFSKRIPIDILESFFITHPKNLPIYFKKIPKQCPFSNWRGANTVKTCSGLINYFKRSIVFNSPYDIQIKIENNEVFSKFGNGIFNDPFYDNLKVHPNNELLDYVDQDKYEVIIKLLFGIHLKCDVPIIVNNPWWYFNEFEVVPGVLNAKKPLELNLFIPVKKGVKEIFIKQHTPLCALNLETEKKIKLNFLKENSNYLFYNTRNYVFTSLKDKILNNKYVR
jgi:hypothetical protein